MAERIAFRGKFPSELEKLQMTRTLSSIKSRQRRSILRKGLDYRKLIAKVQKAKAANSTKAIRTHTLEAVILPSWIGTRFEVHNGKEFQIVQVTANMLGHRLGEFAFTTKSVVHLSPGNKSDKGKQVPRREGLAWHIHLT